MRAVWFGDADEVQVSTAAANYVPITANHQNVWLTTRTSRTQVLGENVTLKKLVVYTTTAPGGATSWTYAFDDDNVATACAVTLTGAAVTGTWEGSVAVAANSMICMRATPASTPATSASTSWWIEYETAGEFFCMLGGTISANSTTVTEFKTPCGVGGGTEILTAVDAEIVIPAAGTVTRLTVGLDTAPVGTDTYTVSMRLNDTSDNLSTVITGAAVSGSTTGTIALVAGDRITIKSVPGATPAAARVSASLTIAPTVRGQTWVGFGGNQSQAGDTTTRYEQPLGRGSNGWGTTEATEAMKVGISYWIHSLYMRIPTAAGSGISRVYTIMDNTAATALAATLTNTTTGSDTTNRVLLSGGGNTLSLRQSPSGGTPAVCAGHHGGFVIEVPQPYAPPPRSGTQPYRHTLVR